ncbi:MAG: hypothetical protein WCB90_13920 [Methanosarcina sp.]
MTQKEKLFMWKEKIADYHQGNLTKKIWAEKNNTTVDTLNYWMKKIKDLESQEAIAPQQFIHIDMSETIETATNTNINANTNSKPVFTLHSGCFSIDILSGFKSQDLHILFEVLGKNA